MSVLKGTKNFYDYEISDIVSHNIKSWLEYGLLEVGAYTNIEFSNSGVSGYTNLQRVYDDRHGDNKVFEGLGPAWVWESGVVPINPLANPPFKASGVQIGATFYSTSTTSGTYEHIVDFENGRVIFTNEIDDSATVQCQYSMRDVAVYLNDHSQWKTIVNEYLTRFDTLGDLSPSGMSSILKHKRVWLPCVVIESQDITNEPLQLGGGEIANCSLYYHIFSDKSFSNKRLANLIVNQEPKILHLYNLNIIPQVYKYNGAVSSGALPYPTLSDKNGPYFWTFARIENSEGGAREIFGDVYRGEVRQTIAVARYPSTY